MSTKWDVLEQVSRNLGDFRYDGVISAATNTGTYAVLTISDITLANSADLDDGYAFIGDVTHKIAVYDPQDKKAYLLPTFATIPAVGATVRMFKDFSKDDYDTVFESTFERLAGRILVDDVDAQAVSTLIDYAAPTTWKYINALEFYGTESQWPQVVGHTRWSIRNASIRLGFTLATDGSYATVSFSGQKHPSVPATDSASLDVYNHFFRDCLSYRMEEQLGLRKLRTVMQTQSMAGTTSATMYGTVSVLATSTEVATISGTATSAGTLAVLEHVTGREERSQDNELQSSLENSGVVNQSAETTDTFSRNAEGQKSILTEEDWTEYVATAKDAADALEIYLYERPKPNSRRLR